MTLISRRQLLRIVGTGAALLGIGAADAAAAAGNGSVSGGPHRAAPASLTPKSARGVVGVPTKIPPPIERGHRMHHEIALEALEVEAEIEPGAKFDYMTYNGQVPGPMIRVRRGDTVTLTLHNNAHSTT